MAVRNFTTSSIKTNSQRNSLFSGAADLGPSTAIVQDGGVYESINLTFGGTNASFGNCNNTRSYAAALASSTRALAIGGYQGTQKTIEYVTIATAGNGTTFGNLVNQKYFAAGSGSATRGIISGGYPNTAYEYVTIATTGDATAFGNATAGNKETLGAFSSPTRSVDFGGNNNSYDNTIRYVTIATTGNGSSFGDLTVNKKATSGCSTSIRGIIQGGQTAAGSNNYTNVIDYVTIATTGNATDFGDLSAGRGYTTSASNSTKGFSIGGRDTSDNSVSTIEYVTIATTGNSVSFSSSVTTAYLNSACSSAHGGL